MIVLQLKTQTFHDVIGLPVQLSSSRDPHSNGCPSERARASHGPLGQMLNRCPTLSFTSTPDNIVGISKNILIHYHSINT